MNSKKDLINKLQIISINFKNGKYLETISKAKKLLHVLPNNEFLNNMIGLSFLNMGNFDEAKSLYLKIIKINPSTISYQNNYANVLKALNETDRAEEILQRIIEREPDYISAINNLANLKKTLKKYNEAIDLYKKALSIKPENSVMLYNIALCYRSLRDLKKTKEYALKINNIDPNFTLADKIISEIQNYDEDDLNHYEIMKKKIDFIKDEESKATLYFALAKANEDKKEYEKSFEYLKKANELRKKKINYNLNEDYLEFNNIKKIYSNISQINFNIQNQNKRIIFVCGMPRSGTTLVEQIISAHSKVTSLGETDFIQRITNKEFKNFSIGLEELVNKKEFSNLIYNNYLSFVDKIDLNKKIYTDKSLLNFKLIGFIKIFFPSSKIVLLKRNFNNNLLSIYKNDLQTQNLGWTYSIKQITNYNSLFNDYLEFWDSNFKNFFLEIKYEELVDKPLEFSKKIINYCDLEWEDNCLKFYKNKSAIDTASANQANKPIYKSSINNFENFKKYFNLR